MPSKLYNQFQTDTNLETKVGIDLLYEDVFFTVKRAGGHNELYQQALRRLTRPVSRQLAQDTLPDDDYVLIMRRAYAQAIIMNWGTIQEDGTRVFTIEDKDGNPMPFSEENFLKLMEDLPDLWDAIQEACSKVSNFRRDMIKVDGEHLGNS